MIAAGIECGIFHSVTQCEVTHDAGALNGAGKITKRTHKSRAWRMVAKLLNHGASYSKYILLIHRHPTGNASLFKPRIDRDRGRTVTSNW